MQVRVGGVESVLSPDGTALSNIGATAVAHAFDAQLLRRFRKGVIPTAYQAVSNDILSSLNKYVPIASRKRRALFQRRFVRIGVFSAYQRLR